MKYRLDYQNLRARQTHPPVRVAAAAPAGGRHPAADPGIRPAAARARRLCGDDDGGDRRGRRRGAEDGLRRLHDQERPAHGPLEPAPARRRRRRRRAGSRLVPRGARRARPGAAAAPERPQLTRRQGARRCGDGCHPQRRAARAGDRGAVGPHPVAVPREPGRDRAPPGREGRAPARPRRRPRSRHPVDAQPPRRLAAARARPRLDARGLRGVVRRGGLRPTSRAGGGVRPA